MWTWLTIWNHPVKTTITSLCIVMSNQLFITVCSLHVIVCCLLSQTENQLTMFVCNAAIISGDMYLLVEMMDAIIHWTWRLYGRIHAIHLYFVQLVETMNISFMNVHLYKFVTKWTNKCLISITRYLSAYEAQYTISVSNMTGYAWLNKW